MIGIDFGFIAEPVYPITLNFLSTI